MCADGLTAPQNRHVCLADDAVRCCSVRSRLYRQVQGVADTIAVGSCITERIVIRALCADGLTTPQNRHICLANRAIRCCGICSRLYRQVQRIADTIAIGSCIANCVVVRALGADGLSAPYNRHVSFANDAIRCRRIRCGLYRQVQGVADTIAS